MPGQLHEPVIEVGTPVCADISEARKQVTQLRAEIIRLARENNVLIAAAGTHPFSHWSKVSITSTPRYERIVHDLQMVARANLVFGLHVHVAVEDNEARIQLMNAVRYFLPHVFSLSVNSPFWCGSNTGWKSYRAKVFERFPRTGLPDYFGSYGEFEDFVRILVATGCIDNAKKIWWDVRPHPFFPTLEYRICDVPMRVDESKRSWCLQEKITYAPALRAADGEGVKVEVRMMFLRPDDESAPILAQNLCRLSRGLMMGVDFNRAFKWVGSSIGLWPEQ